jgi:hypothetical protein
MRFESKFLFEPFRVSLDFLNYSDKFLFALREACFSVPHCVTGFSLLLTLRGLGDTYQF